MLFGYLYYWKNKVELLFWGEVEFVLLMDVFVFIMFFWFFILLLIGIMEVFCVGFDGIFGVILMLKEREKK